MSGISGIGAGGINPYAVQQFQQNLFNQISGGSGSITQSGMEQAVTKAGGTTQAADALYSELDPANTGSVNEQQFAQALPGPPYSSQMQSQMIGYQAQGWPGASTGASATTGASLAQNLFSQIDSNGDGSISQTEVEQAVTSAGGTTQGADALYSQLDPSKTGSVSEQQFLSALQPPSSSGNTAQDALLALLDQATQNASSTSSVSATSGTTAGTTASAGGGNSAQDALMALLKSFDAAQSNAFGGGNSAQDGLMALLNADNGSANGTGNSGSATGNAADLSLAVSLYQNQLNQQLFSGLGTQSAGI